MTNVTRFKAPLDCGVRSEFVETYERDEDGAILIIEVHGLVIENHLGERMQHEHTFKDAAEAERFMHKVNEANKNVVNLNPDCWFETQPCYGSAAYIRDEAYIVEAEKAYDKEHDNDAPKFYRVA